MEERTAMSKIVNVMSNAGSKIRTLRDDESGATSIQNRELTARELDGVAGATTCKQPNLKMNICGIEIVQGCDRIEVTWWDGRETWM